MVVFVVAIVGSVSLVVTEVCVWEELERWKGKKLYVQVECTLKEASGYSNLRYTKSGHYGS